MMANQTSHKTSTKRGNSRIAEYGAATQFPPGRSANPGGRPRKTPYTDAHRQVAELSVEQLKVEKSDSVALATAKAIAKQAVKGRISAAVEAANRAEGTPRQSLEVISEDPITVNVASGGELEELRTKVSRLSERIRLRSQASKN